MTQTIGLVGFNVATGTGELNRQLIRYAGITRWLVKPHTVFRMASLPTATDCIVNPVGREIEDFVESVDTVLFVEVPYFRELLPLCTKHKKHTVCIPMLEWLPEDLTGWPDKVDLFICPTRYCYDQLRPVLPCVYFPWPVDTERFHFRQRTRCETFLFINGHGGFKGRKGWSVMLEALRQWPEMPIFIYDQADPKRWGREVLKSPEDNDQLYRLGDVLISPHSVDGIGLQDMEAMASGIPVISTDGCPWNEIPALDRILAARCRKRIGREVDWYQPDIGSLLSICKSYLGKDISADSMIGRQWAERHSWEAKAVDFKRILRSEPNKAEPSEAAFGAQLQPQQIDRKDRFLFSEAVAAFQRISGRVIVEIGAIRDTRPIAEHTDGWSTVHWAKTGKEVHCIDTDQKAIDVSRAHVCATNVNYHRRDALNFLGEVRGEIDLLYLDGPDAEKGGQEFHLRAFLMAPLASKCLVLIDDCDQWPGRWMGRGKGEFVIPKAIKMGFSILCDNGRQVLLGRGI